MKKFMKKLAKKSEGFTLVELVVVIAILGILAGVAVPAYTGYIAKANQAADITVCDAIKTAVQSAYAMEGDASPAAIVVTDASVQVGASLAAADLAELDGDYKDNFETFYGAEVSSIVIDHDSTVSWNGGDWVFN